MKKWGLGLMALLMMLQAVPAAASGKDAVILKGKQAGEEKIQVQCYTEMGKEITNGKLRLLYDEKKVKLVSSTEGDALEGGMCEINDCLTGNKKEGELVAAFASSENLKEKGNLLCVEFELQEGVEKNEEIAFQLKPEKLSGNNGEIQADNVKLDFIVGKTEEQISNKAEEEKKEEEKKEDDKKNNTSDKDKSSSGSKKSGKVKTGDETEVLKYALLGGGTLVVILGCAVTSKKKKKKR